jgi:NIPSNAP
MIYELRIYTCRPGTVELILNMWEQEGRSMLEPYFKMIGQWTAMSGSVNKIYTLWEFNDLNHREEARAALMKHPGFSEYVARCRECYINQEAIFLSPTAISPLK